MLVSLQKKLREAIAAEEAIDKDRAQYGRQRVSDGLAKAVEEAERIRWDELSRQANKPSPLLHQVGMSKSDDRPALPRIDIAGRCLRCGQQHGAMQLYKCSSCDCILCHAQVDSGRAGAHYHQVWKDGQNTACGPVTEIIDGVAAPVGVAAPMPVKIEQKMTKLKPGKSKLKMTPGKPRKYSCMVCHNEAKEHYRRKDGQVICGPCADKIRGAGHDLYGGKLEW